jgi:hypothetical protein
MTPDELASWGQLADAVEVEAEAAALECGWGAPGDGPLSAWEIDITQGRLRALGWLRVPGLVPPYVREVALLDAVDLVHSLAATERGCAWTTEGISAVYAVPPAPPCVEHIVQREIAAADRLAAWGHPEAADLVAAHAASWGGVRCLPERERREPSRCACGVLEIAPAPMVYGYPPPGGRLIGALDLAGIGGCVLSGRDTAHVCPFPCVPTATVRRGSRRAWRRVDDGPLPWRVTDAGIVAVGDEAVARALDAPPAALLACGDGVAEWLGRWIPWDDAPGSACVAEALASVPATGWAAVEIHERW